MTNPTNPTTDINPSQREQLEKPKPLGFDTFRKHNESERIREIAKEFARYCSVQGTPFGSMPNDDEKLAEFESAIEEMLREAQLQILRGFRRRDFVRADMYEVAVLDRIAALSNQSKEER